MSEIEGLNKEKAFSVIYSRQDWILQPLGTKDKLLEKLHSTNITKYIAKRDGARFAHTVSEHSSKETVHVDLFFKKDSMVIFDGSNHFFYYDLSNLNEKPQR